MTGKSRFMPGAYRSKARRQKRRLRWIWGLLALCLVCYIFVGGDYGLYRIIHQAREKKALQKEMDAIKTQNAQLKVEIALLETDMEYIEKIARERYGMVKKGERLYRILPKPEE